MTKKDIESYISFSGSLPNELKVISASAFYEFLESNVAIPKGTNRHPCSDVLHEAIEDTTKELQVLCSMDGWINSKFIIHNIYRIKQAEPVFEWQWKYKDDNTKLWTYSKYMTDDEFDSFEYCAIALVAVKDEQTKRVRQ